MTTSMRASARPLLAFSLALALAACGGGETADARPSDATMRVGPENITVLEQAMIASGPGISGNLQPEKEAVIRAEVSGAVRATFHDAGSRVGAGTVLAQLDDASVRDSWLSARSAQSTAQTSAEIARRELERQTKLAEVGAIPERELESARRADVAAQSQLADARARLTIAQKQLEDTKVKAPFTGVISDRRVSAGDFVQTGGELFRLIDPTSMRLEASVPASELAAVQVGVPVRFSVNGYPGRTFEGKVSRINPSADPTTGQVRITVSVPNEKQALVGGLFAEGRVNAEARNAISAPMGAVDLRGVRPHVLRLRGGKVERVEVEVGLRDEESERIEITSGVAAGDTLLTGAARGITPGTPVRVAAPSDQPVAKN